MFLLVEDKNRTRSRYLPSHGQQLELSIQLIDSSSRTITGNVRHILGVQVMMWTPNTPAEP